MQLFAIAQHVHKVTKIKTVRAFTLVELLIVIVILGIIASIAIVRYGNVLEHARSSEAYTVLAEIVTAEKRYYLDINPPSYTANFPDLDSFTVAPSSDNFTFTVPSTNETTGYALATHKAGKGNVDYWMCFHSAKKGSGTASCP